MIGARYLRRLADLDHQIAKLMAERSEVLREIVASQQDEPVSPIPFVAPTQLDQARAARALQRNADRRRSLR